MFRGVARFRIRVIPVYIDSSELQESIDFEASLEQGKMIMSSGLLDDASTRCWVVDDGHVLSSEVRHALLIEATRRHILLIMTMNHENQTLDDAEWELVDVHVSIEAPSLETRIAVLQQIVKISNVLIRLRRRHLMLNVFRLLLFLMLCFH